MSHLAGTSAADIPPAVSGSPWQRRYLTAAYKNIGTGRTRIFSLIPLPVPEAGPGEDGTPETGRFPPGLPAGKPAYG